MTISEASGVDLPHIVSQGSGFDVDAFILALAPGSYNISHTIAQWSTGDLEVVDRLLQQANLGVPNYQRI